MELLKKSKNFSGPAGPVVLVIMDGVGIGRYRDGDFVRRANTPTLNWLAENAIASRLLAHGKAVGMPSDGDMGNSEVGHNAIGCGRVFEQGASLVNMAIASRALFDGAVWQEFVDNCRRHDSTLHFIGLLSDGNVHSHIDHLEAMLSEARSREVRRVRIHILLDGRDVPPTSALEYVDRLENFLDRLNADGRVDYCIASGGGRMNVTMDRYGANWQVVATGWQAHVLGKGPIYDSAREAIADFRRQTPGISDQNMGPFVIGRDGEPVGRVAAHDAVIFFNFRGDRALEISQAFEAEEFDKFDRGPRLDVLYAGMMQYDGDTLTPKKFLVLPPAIDRTIGEYLARSRVRQLAISETQKFGHVTYFFNGNRTGKFDESLEDYVEITSDLVPFEERPWMKAAEITDAVVDAVHSGRYGFIRLNYANGDMVGHTGVGDAVEIAVEAVDLALKRLMAAVEKVGGILVVSADHGNSDDMYIRNKKTGKVVIDPSTGQPEPKTSHSLNPVPVYIYNPSSPASLQLSEHRNLGISSLAATVLTLLGFEPPEDYDPSIVEIRQRPL